MSADRTPDRRRLLVLAAHVAALLGGVAYVWAQGADLAAQRAAVAQARQAVEQLDARLARPGALRVAAVSPERIPFVPGESAALAGANLQDRVVSAIRAAGGTVTSSQVDTTVAGPAGGAPSTPPAVQLTVSCQIGNAALQGLRYALETGAPALFFDQFTAESDARGGGGPSAGSDGLKLSMVISAYWTGGGKS